MCVSGCTHTTIRVEVQEQVAGVCSLCAPSRTQEPNQVVSLGSKGLDPLSRLARSVFGEHGVPLCFRLTLNLGHLGWPPTHGNGLASASQGLELQAWTIMSVFIFVLVSWTFCFFVCCPPFLPGSWGKLWFCTQAGLELPLQQLSFYPFHLLHRQKTEEASPLHRHRVFLLNSCQGLKGSLIDEVYISLNCLQKELILYS